METLKIDKSAIQELVQLTHEINERMESLELLGNKDFMKSLKKSKSQIKKRDFADWNAL